MPDRSQAIVQGPNCVKREAQAVLERVGHPINLLLQARDICAGTVAVSLGSELGCRGVYKLKGTSPECLCPV